MGLHDYKKRAGPQSPLGTVYVLHQQIVPNDFLMHETMQKVDESYIGAEKVL